MNLKSQKVLVWMTLILATVFALAYAFLLDFFPPVKPTLSATEVLSLYTDRNLRFRIGVVLMITSGGFLLPWAVVVWAQMARQEKGVPIWSILQALSCALGSWVFVFPAFIWGVAAFSVERDPALTVLMHEFGWLLFISPTTYLPFQFIPVAVVSLTAKNDDTNSAFPRWLGWLGICSMLGTELGSFAQVFKSGPFAWNGLFPFYLPLALYSALLGAMAFTLLRAIKRQEKEPA